MLGNVTGICISASIRLKGLRKHLLSSSINPPKLSKGGFFFAFIMGKADEWYGI